MRSGALGGVWDAEWTSLVGHLGAQNCFKPVTETLPRREWLDRVVWKRRGLSATPISKLFFKTLRAKEISWTHIKGKIRLFRNTRVFPVKCRLGPLDNGHAKCT